MPKGVLPGLGMHDRLKIHDFRSSMSTMSPHVPDNIKGRERARDLMILKEKKLKRYLNLVHQLRVNIHSSSLSFRFILFLPRCKKAKDWLEDRDFTWDPRRSCRCRDSVLA